MELQEQHRWLGRLVGEWAWESEATMAPGEPPSRDRGTERVRSLDGVWVVCEGRGGTPEPGYSTIMTLGYDPARGRFVGSFVGSMMTHLWLYDGALDAAGRVLTLDSEGPSFVDDGTTGRYRDAIEVRGDDERVMTSAWQDAGGEWRHFMTMRYRRTA